MANNKVQLSDGTVLLDLTGDTVTPDTLLEGFTAHGKDGALIVGTLTVPEASIKVTGLSQSDTVTAAMGGKTKMARWVTDGSYWLIDGIRDLGTWTVTATNGTQTVMQDVLVDAITEYEITMAYRLYLYNEGDECEDVTGGYSYEKASSNSEGGLLKNADNLTYYTNNGGNSYVLTANEIPFSDYSFLCGEIDISISGSTNAGFSFGSYTGRVGQITKTDMIFWNTANSTSYSENDVRFKTEIKGSGGLYIYMNGAVTFYGTKRTCVIRKIWLE